MVSTDGWLWVFRAGVGCLLLAALLFLLGYATDHWHDNGSVHYGLWNSCDGARCSALESDKLDAYHIATQGFQTMAVILFGLSPIVHLFVYCCKKRKDTGWRTRVLDVGYSSGIFFQICSLLIFGLENSTPENFSWSYKMSCASAAIAVIGIVMVIISRHRALSKFSFRSVSRSKRKTAASESMTTEKRFDHATSRSNPFHPEEKVITSSASEQPCSMQVPNTHVNINININTGPSNLTSESEQKLSLPTDGCNGQHHPHNSPDITAIVPETLQRLHPKPSDSLVDYPVTKVRSAPKSSTALYTSPTHRRTFGPAEKRRTLEGIDNGQFSNSFSFSGGNDAPLPSISGLTPSAPLYGESDLEENNPPPSYSDTMNGSMSYS